MSHKISQEVLDQFTCCSYLDNCGELDKKTQLEMYYKMNLIREFDSKVRDLWMENKIYGLAHSYVAAEAIAVGVCTTLDSGDCITSTHRGHGHAIAKGADPKLMMAELFGKYEGYNRGKGGSMHIADVDNGMLGATGIVGSGMPIAVGAAIAADLLGNKNVAICFHGDGGTNQGVWHESINMAAAWDLPVVFVTENNHMAIATELNRVCKDTDIYKRASGYGIPGVLVDGSNVFAVYEAAKEAVSLARSGGGPTLIECKFYRLLGHFVADTQDYRNMEKANRFWDLDPIVRMKDYLLENKVGKKSELEKLEERARKEVEEAIDYAGSKCSEPPLSSLYEDLYADGEIII
jgi:acetoin:2,6-dichlorophenolindophenol oxidoreductase subunit alpha